MSILINQEALRLQYKQETGMDRPILENDYVEWLEEKVTEQLEQIKKKEIQQARYNKFDKWMRKAGMVNFGHAFPNDQPGIHSMYTEAILAKRILKHKENFEKMKKDIDQTNSSLSCPIRND